MVIGVFDSGVGGLSVWREIVKVLPGHNYIYVSDNGYCPYGPRPQEYIIDRARKISQFLINKGAQMIVVACNTATAAAIKTLREEFDIPFVGMEPAVKPAALHSKSGVIGVLATRGTFKGELYLRTLHKFASNTQVIEQIGDGLVELVEQGKVHTSEADALVAKYLNPMIEAGADHVVLGCTHYPFLIDAINKVSKGSLIVVNPAPAIANRVEWLLEEAGNEDERVAVYNSVAVSVGNEFYTTGENLPLLESMVNSIIEENGENLKMVNSFSRVEI